MSSNKIRYKRNKQRKKRAGETREEPVDEKWSNTKIHNELSSFIAEFSYLEDYPRSTQRPPQSYQIYPKKKKKYPQNAFRANRSDTQIRKQQGPRKRRNKSVEWIDIPVETRTRYDDQCNIQRCTSQDDVIYEVEGNRSRSKSRGRKRLKRGNKERNKQIIKRDRSQPKHIQCRRAYSEDKKCCRPFKINKSRQSSSLDLRERQLRRRSRSHSKVKYWPLRYERKKVKNIQVRVKRQLSYPKIENRLPSESPTIVQLYPQNTEYIDILDCDASKPILTHKDLPCKCTKCVTKFELLQTIRQKKPYKHTSNFKLHATVPPNECLPCGNRYPQICPYSLMTRPCKPFYPRFPCWPPPYRRGFPRCFNSRDTPCVSPFTIYSDSTDYEDCFAEQRLNSFSIKCNTFGQPINSAITHYFHSILNQQFSCS